MTLYEIDTEFARLIEAGTDPETGELVIDPAALEALQLAREEKLENIALYYKNLNAEAAAIKAEAEALTARRKALEGRAERMKRVLSEALAGEKFSTPRVAVTFRSSAAVEIDAGTFFQSPTSKSYLRYRDPEPDKKAIAEALKAGEDIPGAALVQRQSMTIK